MKLLAMKLGAAIALLGLQCPAGLAYTNVALDKPVTLNGVFGTGSGYFPPPDPLPALPPASIVTDGIFQGGEWTQGVWWDEQFTGVHNTIVIDLQGSYTLNHFAAMADNNDLYQLDYRNPAGVWLPAWSIGEACCGGLTLRETTLATPITANALRISAFTFGADYAFSVSEVQAALLPVPEPSAAAMLIVGGIALGVCLGIKRRKAARSA